MYMTVTNFLLSLTVKENRAIFGKVMGKSLVSCFFHSRCTYIRNNALDIGYSIKIRQSKNIVTNHNAFAFYE